MSLLGRDNELVIRYHSIPEMGLPEVIYQKGCFCVANLIPAVGDSLFIYSHTGMMFTVKHRTFCYEPKRLVVDIDVEKVH